MEAVNGGADGPPPPSPLTGCYLLIVLGEPHTASHKDIILQRLAKGLLSWNVTDCLVDLEKELTIIAEQALEGEEARYGERLIQFASENLVTEILIHPAVSTLAQCVRNLLSSFTRHRHIIHAGYTFAGNGSWILQDGTFSFADFSEAFQESDVQRVIRAYENGISLDIHCAPEGEWTKLPKESFTKSCKVGVNPNDVLTSGSPAITNFINYLVPFLVPAELENSLESSDVVGNIRFSRPTLYVFPGGQGDAALFGINGFNMLVDGGFCRKACFWDFVRHLDRLDAVLFTRLNNSNVNGISAVLRRKAQNAVYPQIGHFFCNLKNRKTNLSPDGDKDRDPLLINLMDGGQEMVSNLRHLDLNPQSCYRDSEPINLYHKVGHGTLDMYVLSPAKDSKEVKEFLLKWNSNDQKLFTSQKSSREFQFPLQNSISICALLVWRPANPNDTITRILFPGSAPQNKIFEGLDKLRNLECIKFTVCTEKSLQPAVSLKPKTKESVLDKITPTEKQKIIDNKKDKPKLPIENKIVDNNVMNGVVNGIQEKVVKKSDSIESEKSTSKPSRPKKDEAKLIENNMKPEKVAIKPKIDLKMGGKPKADQQTKSKAPEKKISPSTPKKIIDTKVNGEIKEMKPRQRKRISPSATPAKSTKDANNRKVLESKIKASSMKEIKALPDKKDGKQDRKPISRRPKGQNAKVLESPVKRLNGIQKPDSISRKGKLDKEGTTDSSTVSTPSADQDSLIKKDISKLSPEEVQKLRADELADLKEEQEAVKELEAVFRKSEKISDKPSDLRKIQDISLEDKIEPEEYIIIEKEVIEQKSIEEDKENETQKLARDSEESEKPKDSTEKESDKVINIFNEDMEASQLEESENRLVKEEKTDVQTGECEIQETELKSSEIASKDESIVSPEDKNVPKKISSKELEEEVKEIAQESQPDEKVSANLESGATTTAPTLPEDERMTLNEIKEDNADLIEEKYVKEETKEKDGKDIPVIEITSKLGDNLSKVPTVVGIRLDKQSHIRDIVKTPDEVADLPVHEEVDIDHIHDYNHDKIETKDKIKSDNEGAKESGQLGEQLESHHVEEKHEEEYDIKAPIDGREKVLEDSHGFADIEKKVDDLPTEIVSKPEFKPVDKDFSPAEEITSSKDNIGKEKSKDLVEEQKDIEEEVLDKDDAELETNGNIEFDECAIKDVAQHPPIDIKSESIDSEIGKTKPFNQSAPQYSGTETRRRSIQLDTDAKHSEKTFGDFKQQEIPDEKSILSHDIEKQKSIVPTIEETSINEVEKFEEEGLNEKKKVCAETERSVTTDVKVDDKDISEIVSELEEETPDIKIEEIKIDHVEEREHAESVVIKSQPESPVTDNPILASDFIEKSEIGRKSPKEREEDVAKIVASVAEVLKSDAPLEEFEGKIPFSPSPSYGSFTTELRETHITTVDSPVGEKVFENEEVSKAEKEDSHGTPEVTQKAEETSEVVNRKDTDTEKTIANEDRHKQLDDQEIDPGTVHRMLVTASSEDGGEEIEICPVGSIVFPRSPESSGRSSPDNQSQKISERSSILETSESLATVKLITKGADTEEYHSTDIHQTKNVALDDQLPDVRIEKYQTETETEGREKHDMGTIENMEPEMKVLEGIGKTSDIISTPIALTVKDSGEETLDSGSKEVKSEIDSGVEDSTEVESIENAIAENKVTLAEASSEGKFVESQIEKKSDEGKIELTESSGDIYNQSIPQDPAISPKAGIVVKSIDKILEETQIKNAESDIHNAEFFPETTKDGVDKVIISEISLETEHELGKLVEIVNEASDTTLHDSAKSISKQTDDTTHKIIPDITELPLQMKDEIIHEENALKKSDDAAKHVVLDVSKISQKAETDLSDLEFHKEMKIPDSIGKDEFIEAGIAVTEKLEESTVKIFSKLEEEKTDVKVNGKTSEVTGTYPSDLTHDAKSQRVSPDHVIQKIEEAIHEVVSDISEILPKAETKDTIESEDIVTHTPDVLTTERTAGSIPEKLEHPTDETLSDVSRITPTKQDLIRKDAEFHKVKAEDDTDNLIDNVKTSALRPRDIDDIDKMTSDTVEISTKLENGDVSEKKLAGIDSPKKDPSECSKTDDHDLVVTPQKMMEDSIGEFVSNAFETSKAIGDKGIIEIDTRKDKLEDILTKASEDITKEQLAIHEKTPFTQGEFKEAMDTVVRDTSEVSAKVEEKLKDEEESGGEHLENVPIHEVDIKDAKYDVKVTVGTSEVSDPVEAKLKDELESGGQLLTDIPTPAVDMTHAKHDINGTVGISGVAAEVGEKIKDDLEFGGQPLKDIPTRIVDFADAQYGVEGTVGTGRESSKDETEVVLSQIPEISREKNVKDSEITTDSLTSTIRHENESVVQKINGTADKIAAEVSGLEDGIVVEIESGKEKLQNAVIGTDISVHPTVKSAPEIVKDRIDNLVSDISEIPSPANGEMVSRVQSSTEVLKDTIHVSDTVESAKSVEHGITEKSEDAVDTVAADDSKILPLTEMNTLNKLEEATKSIKHSPDVENEITKKAYAEVDESKDVMQTASSKTDIRKSSMHDKVELDDTRDIKDEVVSGTTDILSKVEENIEDLRNILKHPSDIIDDLKSVQEKSDVEQQAETIIGTVVSNETDISSRIQEGLDYEKEKSKETIADSVSHEAKSSLNKVASDVIDLTEHIEKKVELTSVEKHLSHDVEKASDILDAVTASVHHTTDYVIGVAKDITDTTISHASASGQKLDDNMSKVDVVKTQIEAAKFHDTPILEVVDAVESGEITKNYIDKASDNLNAVTSSAPDKPDTNLGKDENIAETSILHASEISPKLNDNIKHEIGKEILKDIVAHEPLIRDEADAISDKTKNAAGKLVSNIIDITKNELTSGGETLKEGVEKASDSLASLKSSMQNTADSIFGEVKNIAEGTVIHASEMKNKLDDNIKHGMDVGEKKLDDISKDTIESIDKVKSSIHDKSESFAGKTKDTTDKVISDGKAISSKIEDKFIHVVESGKDSLGDLIKGTTNAVETLKSDIHSTVTSALDKTKNLKDDTLSHATEISSSLGEELNYGITSQKENLQEINKNATDALENVKSSLHHTSESVQSIKDKVCSDATNVSKQLGENIKQEVEFEKNKLHQIATHTTDAMDNITSSIIGTTKSIFSKTKDSSESAKIEDNLFQTIQSAAEKIESQADKFSSNVDNIKSEKHEKQAIISDQNGKGSLLKDDDSTNEKDITATIDKITDTTEKLDKEIAEKSGGALNKIALAASDITSEVETTFSKFLDSGKSLFSNLLNEEKVPIEKKIKSDDEDLVSAKSVKQLEVDIKTASIGHIPPVQKSEETSLLHDKDVLDSIGKIEKLDSKVTQSEVLVKDAIQDISQQKDQILDNTVAELDHVIDKFEIDSIVGDKSIDSKISTHQTEDYVIKSDASIDSDALQPSLDNVSDNKDICDISKDNVKSALEVIHPQGKKLSVSDVEIIVAGDKMLVQPKEMEDVVDNIQKEIVGSVVKDVESMPRTESQSMNDIKKISHAFLQYEMANVESPTVCKKESDIQGDTHITGTSLMSTNVETKQITNAGSPKGCIETLQKETEIRSVTPGSDDFETTTQSDLSSSQFSKVPQLFEDDRIESDDDDFPGSPASLTSQLAHSRSSSHYGFEEETSIPPKIDPMHMSLYGALPDEPSALYEVNIFDEPEFETALKEHKETRGEHLVKTEKDGSDDKLDEVHKHEHPKDSTHQERDNLMTASFIGELPTAGMSGTDNDVIKSWGKPLGLPSPAPPSENKGTPKKEKKLPSNVVTKNKINDDKRRSESPSKNKLKKVTPVYVDLTYVPHHGNANYSYVDFFRRVRSRYYVFSGIEPSREVYNALLEAKQSWEDKDLEVTIIPTYDTDVLGYWVAENEELLTKYKIDLSPSASRCTINLQDHETSCSAYRLEF